MNGTLEPFVLRGIGSIVDVAEWTPEVLANLITDQQLSMRVGKKVHEKGRILWETETPMVKATFRDFADWESGHSPAAFDGYKRSENWCYVDYKDMFDLFPNEILKVINWSVLGLDRDGFDSTFWMGTAGAYTPCHYDTYGFNLVAQVFGRKRWILFPPTDSLFLEPSRIPYEESSVFSRLDILSCPTELTNTRPHIVILEPGDVLYVPSLWWHSVQCLDTAITINTWVPIPGDSKQRVFEAVTRYMLGKLQLKDVFLNPSETSLESEDSLDMLQLVIDDCQPENGTGTHSPNAKRARILSDAEADFITKFGSQGIPVPQVSFDELKSVLISQSPLTLIDPCASKDNVKVTNNTELDILILDAVTQPSTIQSISERLLMKLKK